jgi:hypothetical protein
MTDFSVRTKEEIFALIQQTATELFSEYNWSGLQSGSFEWMIGMCVAEVSEMIARYQDERAKQAYISVADLRRDIRNICKNIGLVPLELSAATTTLEFVASNDVTIPLGTRVATDSGIKFSTVADLTLSNGSSLTGSIVAVNAEHISLSFLTSGNINERLSLHTQDVVKDYITVMVNNILWNQVDTFSDSIASSKVYTIDFDDSNQMVLVFGDGIYGQRLPAASVVSVDIFYGGGPGGNVVLENQLTTLIDSFSSSANISSVTNTIAASGGNGPQTVKQLQMEIPAQLRNISGLINKEDIAATLKANLTWLADATVQNGFTTINGLFIPTATIYAYPYASTIIDKSITQDSELSALLDLRGVVGVQWNVEDAYSAPLSLVAEVNIKNRALQLSKEQDIKNAITSNTSAPFEFSSLSFDRDIFTSDIINAINAVINVNYCNIKEFSVKPYAISNCELYPFADLELTSSSEDGYFAFSRTGTSAATCRFFMPFKTSGVGYDYITDDSKDWLVEEFTFEDNSAFGANEHIIINTNKLEFAQPSKVWTTNEFYGSNWNQKYLLKVGYSDNSGVYHYGYYHIASTTAPNIITTSENANAPIYGSAIPDMSTGTYSNITVDIIEDKTNGTTGLLVTPTGANYTILCNNSNSLFIASPSAPINNYSHIVFADTSINFATSSYVSQTGALKARLYPTSGLPQGAQWFVYTTPLLANKLRYKAPNAVFTLDQSDIIIKFV